MRFYTGIGSRATPQSELNVCAVVAAFLERSGLILRSGGADGADQAFERGVIDPKNKIILRPKHSTLEAEKIASQIHPMWSMCNDYARKLHGRNVQLVLGEDLKSPSEFVLAWTFDGKDRGGTRTGLVLAKERGIPTYNLADDQERLKLAAFLLKIRRGS